MENMQQGVWGFVKGVWDSVFGIRAIIQLLRGSRRATQRDEPSISVRLSQCCLMNGGVCILGIFFFKYLIVPALWSLFVLLFGNTRSELWDWLHPTLEGIFDILYVVPHFVLSRIVNALWFQDIANSSYRILRGRPQSLPRFSKFVADLLFSTCFEFLFLVQSMLTNLVPLPVIREVLAILHLSLLYGIYIFEYKWVNMGWELHQRLSFIENNWPYFVGFGFPLALLTFATSSYIINTCVVSLVFPLFIISGHKATPVTSCDHRLPLFSPVVYLCNMILHWMIDPRARGLSAPVAAAQRGPSNPPVAHTTRREHSAQRDARGRRESGDQRASGSHGKRRESSEQRIRREFSDQQRVMRRSTQRTPLVGHR